MEILQEIIELLQRGRAPKVKELVTKALEEGVKPQVILEDSLLAGMSVVGDKFRKNEVFVPEVLIAARAMNAGVDILRPYLIAEGITTKGTAVLGTVKGDLHDIGKNIVKVLLESYGFEVIDLGKDVEPEKVVECAKENRCKLVGLSALMTTTVASMEETIKLLKQADSTITVVVGGAVLTEEYSKMINADAYCPDAMAMVRFAESFYS